MSENKAKSAFEVEALDRLRRIETRLTKYLETQGVETVIRRPLWDGDGIIRVPSPGTSLSEILSVIPTSWPDEANVAVLCKGKYLCSLRRVDDL